MCAQENEETTMRKRAEEPADARAGGGSGAIVDDSGASLAIVGAAATLVALGAIGIALGSALSLACITPAAALQLACIAG